MPRARSDGDAGQLQMYTSPIPHRQHLGQRGALARAAQQTACRRCAAAAPRSMCSAGGQLTGEAIGSWLSHWHYPTPQSALTMKHRDIRHDVVGGDERQQQRRGGRDAHPVARPRRGRPCCGSGGAGRFPLRAVSGWLNPAPGLVEADGRRHLGPVEHVAERGAVVAVRVPGGGGLRGEARVEAGGPSRPASPLPPRTPSSGSTSSRSSARVVTSETSSM